MYKRTSRVHEEVWTHKKFLVDKSPPQCIYGRHFKYLQLDESLEQADSQNFFFLSTPEPPLHLAHTVRGEVVSKSRPTGTHVLKIKE